MADLPVSGLKHVIKIKVRDKWGAEAAYTGNRIVLWDDNGPLVSVPAEGLTPSNQDKESVEVVWHCGAVSWNSAAIAGADTLTVPGITVPAQEGGFNGGMLLVAIGHDDGTTLAPVAISTVTWNGESLSPVTEQAAGANTSLTTYLLEEPTPGTGDLVVTFDASCDSAVAGAMFVDNATSLEVAAGAAGTGTAVLADAGALGQDDNMDFAFLLLRGTSLTADPALTTGWEQHGPCTAAAGPPRLCLYSFCAVENSSMNSNVAITMPESKPWACIVGSVK